MKMAKRKREREKQHNYCMINRQRQNYGYALVKPTKICARQQEESRESGSERSLTRISMSISNGQVLPDRQRERRERESSSFGLGRRHISKVCAWSLATAALLLLDQIFSWTAGGFKTVKISNKKKRRREETEQK